MKDGRAKATNEEIAAALEQTRGLVSLAAKLLLYNRAALHRRIKRNAALRAKVKEGLELRKDMAEAALHTMATAKGPSQLGAICFFLKCQAKDRGYIERQEFTGKGGGPMGISLFDILVAAEAKEQLKGHE